MAKLAAMFRALALFLQVLFKKPARDTSIDYEDGEPHKDHIS